MYFSDMTAHMVGEIGSAIFFVPTPGNVVIISQSAPLTSTIKLGPVVQSVVSLTSSLRVISLTVLADSIHNILIFFAKIM